MMHVSISASASTSTALSAQIDPRGRYNELLSVERVSAAQILNKFAPCLPESFISLDRKGRGDALNLDLYGYDPEQNVAVVQVRQYFKRAAKHFGNVRKTYVLCGFNEIGTPFRHPIGHGPIHGAVRRGESPAGVVRAAQCWMWNVTEKKLAASLRQGDVLLVPERGSPDAERAIDRGGEAVLAETHVVRAERIAEIEGRLYALNPTLEHTKQQHQPVAAPRAGWWSVRLARQEAAWDFSARLSD